MLMAALMAGFFAAVNADTRSNALDKDQTRAYAAAHAGLEKLTSDLAALFNGDVSPSMAQINALAALPADDSRLRVSGARRKRRTRATRVTWKADANGNPAPDDPHRQHHHGRDRTEASRASSRSIRSPSRRDRRPAAPKCACVATLQTVAVPVFQFGLFSETDLSFFAGPDFNFGGRVHTNGTLFLAEGDNNTLTLSDRVTAADEIIRWQLSNGFAARQPTTRATSACVTSANVPGTLRNLARTEGSLVQRSWFGRERADLDVRVDRHLQEQHPQQPNRRQAAEPAHRVAGATPIDLIRRPADGERRHREYCGVSCSASTRRPAFASCCLTGPTDISTQPADGHRDGAGRHSSKLAAGVPRRIRPGDADREVAWHHGRDDDLNAGPVQFIGDLDLPCRRNSGRNSGYRR